MKPLSIEARVRLLLSMVKPLELERDEHNGET